MIQNLTYLITLPLAVYMGYGGYEWYYTVICGVIHLLGLLPKHFETIQLRRKEMGSYFYFWFGQIIIMGVILLSLIPLIFYFIGIQFR